MAGNQREMRRAEKRAAKDRKNRIIVWIIIAVIVIILAVMKISEININSIKNRFTDENGGFTLSQTVSQNNFPYNIGFSSQVTILPVNNKLGVMTPAGMTVLDGKEGKAEYSFEHGYSNPILAQSGIYTLVYDQGARKLRLDTTSDAVYESETASNILCADIAKNGTAVYATTSKEKMSDICVVSKSLDKIYETKVSYGYVIAAAINDSANRFAYAAVNSENAVLKTKIFVCSIKNGDVSEYSVDSGALIDLQFSGKNLFAVGDSFVACVKNNGEFVKTFKPGQIRTQCFTFTPSGELVLAYNKYNNSTDSTIVRVKSNGNVKTEIKINGGVKSLGASSRQISALTNDKIITYALSNGEKQNEISAGDSAKHICRLGSDVFIFHQSVIDKSEVKSN